MTLLHEYSTNHKLLSIETSKLIGKVGRWNKNRYPDTKRLPYIKDAIIRRGFMEGILYIAQFTGTDNYVCYDGSHRFETIKNMGEKNRPKCVIVDLMEDVTEDTIINRFKELNQSIPVPELYINDENIHKEKCEELINKFCNEWKDHTSHSQRPHKPNFNRDSVIISATSPVCYKHTMLCVFNLSYISITFSKTLQRI